MGDNQPADVAGLKALVSNADVLQTSDGVTHIMLWKATRFADGSVFWKDRRILATFGELAYEDWVRVRRTTWPAIVKFFTEFGSEIDLGVGTQQEHVGYCK